MFSWNDFINDFPYTNFSDINVSWFLNKFKQIFDEWSGLYTSLQEWKNATDAYNEQWRQQQEQAFQNWENSFQSAIDEWKVQTETGINTWEQDTIANLETWKNAFITEYNALKAQVEQIAVDAENAKNSAEQSAQNAEQSAQTAEEIAQSLNTSLTQIGINTVDISALKRQLNNDKTAPVGYVMTASNDGNGTEWTLAGTPTDEQTQTAISNWLTNHPEATTTVQDNSLTEAKFTDTLKLKTIKDYVTPEMYGAYGDDTHDDTQSIQAMFDSATALNMGVLFPNKTYLVTGPIIVPDVPTCIYMYGLIHGTYDGDILTLGRSGYNKIGGSYKIKIKGDNKANSVGLKIINFNNSHVELAYISKCAVGVKICGYEGGTQWTNFEINRIYECIEGIVLTNAKINNNAGWVNGNYFFGGAISTYTQSPFTSNNTAIVITSDDGLYLNNTNIFENISLENNARCIKLSYASGNIFNNIRFEENSSHIQTIIVENQSSGNIIKSTYEQNVIVGDIGTNIFIQKSVNLEQTLPFELYKSPDLYNKTITYEISGVNYKKCPSIRFMRSGIADISSYSSLYEIDTDGYLKIKASGSIVTKINTKINKQFIVYYTNKNDANCRIYIKMYDTNGDVITNKTPVFTQPPYTKYANMTHLTASISANLQDGFITSANVKPGALLALPEECVECFIGLSGYNAEISAREYSIYAKTYETPNTVSSEKNISTGHMPNSTHNPVGLLVGCSVTTGNTVAWIFGGIGWKAI